MLSKQVPLGIYEKALPAGSAGWSGCNWRNNSASILLKCQWMRRTNACLAWTGAANSVWHWLAPLLKRGTCAFPVPQRPSSFSAWQ